MPKDFYTLDEIAQTIGARLEGDHQCKIYGIASLRTAKEGEVSFLVNSRYQLVASARYEKFLPNTKASAVILAPIHANNCPVNKLIIDEPYQGFLKLAALFVKQNELKPGIHPTVQQGTGCEIAPSVSIGPNCVIGKGCKIGENTKIEANTVIEDRCSIGHDTHIHPNVTLYHDVQIGSHVVIHSGAVIGSEGFGMVRDKEGWKKIPHLASVVIGDHVEVGANTTIDRGALQDTVIEEGVKLDNLIQIAHGVFIGKHTVIAGCVGVAGSTQIGENCMIGGATGISDNVVIADNVIFTGMGQVTKSISKPGIYSSGTGILPQRAWQKMVARLHNLDDMARKLKKLENNNNE